LKTSFGNAPRSRRRHRRNAPLAEINVVPLVDVVLVLLIIFMATAAFTRDSALALKLPSAQTGNTEQTPREVSLALTRSGQLFVDGSPLSEAQLTARLRGVSQRSRDTRVVIRADESVAYARVVRLMDMARAAGLTRVALGTRTGD
jgi:biopolymer transport protein ExbD